MSTETESTSHRPILDEDLEFIDRLLFYEFDKAYSKNQDGHPNHDQVLAFESALETMAAVRKELGTEDNAELRETAEETLRVLEEIDDPAEDVHDYL